MALEDVLVHTATPVRTEPDPDEVPGSESWVEGEYDEEPVEGTPFDCCLFLPLGIEEPTPRGGRNVRRPTLLYGPEDRSGVPVALSAEDELLIVAEELNVAEGRAADEAVRWQVDGRPQPFGPPGEELVGLQARLVRVDD